VALSALALLPISLGSHSAALDVVSGLVDWLHVLMMGAWLGGLVQLALVLPGQVRRLAEPERGAALAAVVGRFSALALPAVVLLALSGAYAAAAQVGAPVGLTDSLYGRTLLAKSALFLPMLLVAALNLLWVGPRLAVRARRREPAGPFTRRFRIFVTVEAALGLGILLVVGVLTNLAPPRDLAPSGLFSRPVVQSSAAGDIRVDLAVKPARPGVNEIALQLTTADGRRPFAPAAPPVVRARPVDQPLGEVEVLLQSIGPGRYSARGPYLSVPGAWQLTVSVGRPGQPDLKTAFRFPLPDRGGIGGAPPDLRNGLTLAALPVLALAFLAARAAIGGEIPALRRAGQALLAFGLVVGGVTLGAWGVSRNTPAASAAVANPFPPDATSLARGQQVYSASCERCHGPGGHGDGAAAGRPPPLDLTVHVPFHSDGELSAWIRDGVAGSAMPAFRDSLSEDDRWHVLNYLHALADASRQ
jgi:uncharacterized membrane protein/mono/diheme cytochrome c family protein